MKCLRFAATPVLLAAMLLAVRGGVAAPRAAQFGNLRLAFEANNGQADSSVRYLSRGLGYTLLLQEREAILALAGAGNTVETVGFQWLGSTAPVLHAEQPTGGVTNYLTARFQRQGIPHFSRVRYSGLYRGIDLVYYGAEKQLEYDLVVSPGADPAQARFRIAGARSVALRDGELQIALKDREVRQRRPVVYQMVDGVRRPVTGEYVLLGRNEFGFRVGRYDKSRELIIDPIVSYTFVRGGASVDRATSIALDAAGNAYVGGYSTSSDMPLLNPYRSTFLSGEALVMKVSPTGGAVYVTFLGGSQDEIVHGIAVDDTGSVYVTGETRSNDMFPAPLRAHSGGRDAFLAKLSPAGNTLTYGTYMGGSGDDYGQGVALSATKDAYVTGWTESSNFNGQTGSGVSQAAPDAFLARVNAAGNAIDLSTYRGGTGIDRAYAIAVDGAGNVYIGGETSSTNLAGTAVQPGNAGATDGFISKWDANGQVVYWAYLGGSAADVIRAIDTDGTNNVYVAGSTLSADFPRVNAIQNTKGDAAGNNDAFVTKYNDSGTQRVYSTFLGGNSHDFALGLTVDSTGSAYVSGSTQSSTFPMLGSIKTTPPSIGTHDAFVTQINSAGTAWVYSTLLGGAASEALEGIAVDSAGAAYAAGYTGSSELTSTTAGNEQALVMKITNCSYAVNPGILNVTAGPQTRIVTVQTTAGCTWSATPNPFVSIQGPASGTGPGTVTFAFTANPGLARNGSVTVAGQPIPVNQGGSVSANCTYGLSSAGASVPYTGTAAAVTLTTTGTCAWQGYSNTSWLQLFPLGGTGTSSLSYTVFPNFRPTARQATITAGGQTFTVNQDANPLNADQRFVQLIYFSFFGRLPSTDELDLQVNQGLGTAKDYAGLAMGFLNSLEFNLGGRFVAGLYVGLLDRNAEFGGWQFQRDAKGRGDISPQAMVNNFLSSGEYTLRFGHPDNAEFVRLLYRYILRREATAQEVTNQSNRLQPQGTMTRADLAYLFLNSDEFRQKLDARLTAFLLYATLLLRDASPDEMALRMGQLANATPATVKQIVGEIIQSPEFKLVVGWP